ADLPAIADGLHLSLDDLDAAVERFHAAPVYRPIPVKQDITVADEAFIAAHRDEFPELETIMASRRLYPKNGFAANVIGYVGEPDARQLASGQLQPGAVVGAGRWQAYYNRRLMGTDGERRVMV